MLALPFGRVVLAVLAERASLPSQSVPWRWPVGVMLAIGRQGKCDEIVGNCQPWGGGLIFVPGVAPDSPVGRTPLPIFY